MPLRHGDRDTPNVLMMMDDEQYNADPWMWAGLFMSMSSYLEQEAALCTCGDGEDGPFEYCSFHDMSKDADDA